MSIDRSKIDKLKEAHRRLKAATGRLRGSAGVPSRPRQKSQRKPARPPKKTAAARQPSHGVGTQLTIAISECGVQAKQGCSCKSLAKELDQEGPAACRQKIDSIVDRMRENYAAYGLSEKLSAGVQSLPQILCGKINPLDPLRSLVTLAIDRAELPRPSPYWRDRAGLDYWQTAIAFAVKYAYCNGPGHLLDVGGGVTLGANYLLDPRLSKWTKTAVDPGPGEYRIPGVTLVRSEFERWRPMQTSKFDAALCLQVLEHVRDPQSFCEKLFGLSDVVVISIPYQWRAGLVASHRHDPIGEAKLKSWTGRDPIEQRIVDPPGRLVAVYL